MYFAINYLLVGVAVCFFEKGTETRVETIIDFLATLLSGVAFIYASESIGLVLLLASLVQTVHLVAVLDPKLIGAHWPVGLKIGFVAPAFYLSALGNTVSAVLLILSSLISYIGSRIQERALKHSSPQPATGAAN